MLLSIIDSHHLALILASLAGIAVYDGLMSIIRLKRAMEGIPEAVFGGFIFAFTAISINTGGVVLSWLSQDWADLILIILVVALIIIVMTHAIRRPICHTVVNDDVPPAEIIAEK